MVDQPAFNGSVGEGMSEEELEAYTKKCIQTLVDASKGGDDSFFEDIGGRDDWIRLFAKLRDNIGGSEVDVEEFGARMVQA